MNFRVAVGLDAVMAFVADADLLVVLDVLVPVALGMQVDLFFAPVLSSMRSSLYPPPPPPGALLRVLNTLRVLFAGSS